MTRTARVLLVAAGFLVGAVLLLAQTSKAHPAPPAAHPVPAAHAGGRVQPAMPQPTELERTQLENIQLRMMLLGDEERSIPQRQQQLQEQYGALVQQIQREHPGFVWNPQTSALVPQLPVKPAPAAKAAR